MAKPIYIQNASLAHGKNTLFSNLNLEIPGGAWVALLGPSGIGKSSLLKMIADLSAHHSTYLGNISSDNLLPISKQIAYMDQSDLLLPWLTVFANATLSLKLKKNSKKKHLEKKEKAYSLLNQVGLSSALHLYPHEISGGMRQRVALVRTLLEDKPIVLMDEPFSALDAITRFKLQELAIQLLANKTVLFITHDPLEALRLSDHIFIMQGKPAQLKLITKLTSKTPRKLNDPDVIFFQEQLYQALTESSL